jgi:hypothetical protein
MPGFSDDFFSDAGSSVSDLFGAAGDAAEASAYGKAAAIAGQNAEISKQSTAIQQSQASRQIYQSLGGINAAAAGNGLAEGGSAGAIYRSSAYQGALTKQLIGRQGLINENSFLAEQASYTGMQSAANAASAGGVFGGILKGAGAVASFAGIF